MLHQLNAYGFKEYIVFDDIILYWPRWKKSLQICITQPKIHENFYAKKMTTEFFINDILKKQFVPKSLKIFSPAYQVSSKPSSSLSKISLQTLQQHVIKMLPYFFQLKNLEVIDGSIDFPLSEKTLHFAHLYLRLSNADQKGVINFGNISGEEKEPQFLGKLDYNITENPAGEKNFSYTGEINKIYFPLPFFFSSLSQSSLFLDGSLSGKLSLMQPIWESKLLLTQQKKTPFTFKIEKDVRVKNFSLSLSANENFIALENSLTLNEAKLNVLGKIASDKTTKDWKGNVDIQLENGCIPISQLSGLWPKIAASEARTWIIEHFHGGKVYQTSCHLDLFMKNDTALPVVLGVKGNLALKNVDISFLDGLKAAKNVKAIANFDEKQFDIKILKGNFEHHTINDGKVWIKKLDKEIPEIEISLNLEGKLKALFDILNKPVLGYLKHVPIDFSSVKGKNKTFLFLSFPLISDLKMKQVQIKSDVNAKDVEFKLSLKNLPLTIKQGNLGCKVTKEEIHLNGESLIEHAKSKWKWDQKFDEKGSGVLKIEMLPSIADLEKYLPFLLTPYLSGTVWLKGEYHPLIEKPFILSDFSLEKASGAIPYIQWKKAIGKPCSGKIHLNFNSENVLKDGKLEFNNSLQGDLNFSLDENQTLKTLKASLSHPHYYNLQFSEGTQQTILFQGDVLDFSCSENPESIKTASIVSNTIKKMPTKKSLISKNKNLSYPPKKNYPKNRVTNLSQKHKKQNLSSYSGPCVLLEHPSNPDIKFRSTSPYPTFDLNFSPSINSPETLFTQGTYTKKNSANDKKIENKKDFLLQFSCKKIVLPSSSLHNLSGKIEGTKIDPSKSLTEFSNLLWRIGKIQGSAENGAQNADKSFSLSIHPEKQHSLIILKSKDAGSLLSRLGVSTRAKGGELFLKANQCINGNYEAILKINDIKINAPLLTKIIALASPTGFMDLFSRDLTFSSISGGLHYKNGQLFIEKMVGKGINLGLSLEGMLDLEKKHFALTGTIIPAYFFNTIFSYIPILGRLFGGDQGIISTNFSLTGPFDDPYINISPISAITPNFIKDLLNIFNNVDETISTEIKKIIK